MKKTNLNRIGKQFGKLTILEAWKNEKGNWKCLCQCDCGNKKEVYWSNLLSGRTHSCGCLKKTKQISRILDLTGQHFGRLLAKKSTEQRIKSSVVWECLCDCGQICYVTARNLMRGDTKSCGCLRKEKGDLTGQHFGKLLAVAPVQHKEYGVILWLCRCDCGKECRVSAGNLKSGHTKSCGCLRRERTQECPHP